MLELNKKIHTEPGIRPMGRYKLADIHMRDPFLFTDTKRQCYFLFGTTMEICDGAANVDPYFEVYYSEDLLNFEGPFASFVPPKGFFGVRNYWAPEVFEYKEKYYMFATFKGGIGKDRGTAILCANYPEGPYKPHSDGHVTLKGNECLDGTLFIDKSGNPWIVFCHEWTQMYYGTIKALPLSSDLRQTIHQAPVVIVDTQKDAIPWMRQMKDPRVGKSGYLTDAPFLYYRQDGGIDLLWSSYSIKNYKGSGKGGYVVAICQSPSGSLEGPWFHLESLLLDENTGHSSLFQDLSGNWNLISHGNDTLHGFEYPIILPIETEGELKIKKKKERTDV